MRTKHIPTATRYTILKTKWGYFGLAGTDYGLLRSFLPVRDPQRAKSEILTELESAGYDRALFKKLQEQIRAYFEGTYVDFGRGIPLLLDGFSDFSRSVLGACRGIRFGHTISYGMLAQQVGKPGAARAVGRIMAGNPVPLIIPCHRVVRSDGTIGGFSAGGGVRLKKRLLELERQGGARGPVSQRASLVTRDPEASAGMS